MLQTGPFGAFERMPPKLAPVVQVPVAPPADTPAYAKLSGKFTNKDRTHHDFTRYVDNLPCVLGRSKERSKDANKGTWCGFFESFYH